MAGVPYSDPDGGGGVVAFPPKAPGHGGPVGGAFAGGATIQAPSGPGGLTPNALAARYAKGKPLNVLTLPGQKWFPISIEVPTVLTPLYPLDYMLFFAPEYQARSTSAFLGAAPDSYTNKNFQVSVGPGNIYLPWPGMWQIYNPSGTDATMLVVDATDPLVGVRYMSEPGCHAVTATRSNALSFAAQTVILGANRYRTGFIFQNDHATTSLRLTFMSDAAVGGAAPQGILVAPGQIIQFGGSNLIKQQVQVIAVGGVGGSYQCFEIF